MQVNQNNLKVINVFFRPIGYQEQPGKPVTLEEIRTWKKQEKPNIVQEQSLLTIIGIVGTVIGAITGLIGLKSENPFVKVAGGILGVLGIVGAAVGKFFGLDLESSNSVSKSNIQESKPTPSEKSQKEKFIDEIVLITSDNNLSSGFNENSDYETDPDSFGGKYIKSIKVLTEKYGRSSLVSWIGEILDSKKLADLDSVENNEEALKQVYSAILCSAVISDDSVTEKLFGYVEDPKLPKEVKTASFLGLTLREAFVTKDSKITLKLIEQLRNKDDSSRVSAVIALGKIKDKRAVEPLSKLLEDPVLDVPMEVAKAFGKIKTPESIQKLVSFYINGVRSKEGGTDYRIQIYAMDALKSNAKYSVSCLIDNLDSYYKGDTSEKKRKDEGYVLCDLLRDLNDEKLNQVVFQWGVEIINNYYENNDKKSFSNIFKLLELTSNNKSDFVNKLVEISTRNNSKMVDNYDPLITELEMNCTKGTIVEFCKAMIEAYHSEEIKNKPAHAIEKLKELIGESEVNKLI